MDLCQLSYITFSHALISHLRALLALAPLDCFHFYHPHIQMSKHITFGQKWKNLVLAGRSVHIIFGHAGFGSWGARAEECLWGGCGGYISRPCLPRTIHTYYWRARLLMLLYFVMTNPSLKICHQKPISGQILAIAILDIFLW